ncbi:MAG: GTP-binding protein [Proteobacteria bacterium]|nr:GTP-binding protein [Pseudomonadota bacterium]
MAAGNKVMEALRLAEKLLPADIRDRVNDKLISLKGYVPNVGVLGKTGAGKSSLCNALFGTDVCKISDVEACTRQPQKVLLANKNKYGVALTDMPGVGESLERDREYEALYEKTLPEFDVILWALKADDRAYSVDLEFYKKIVKPHIEAGKAIIFVLTQADKIEPFREWNTADGLPGKTQLTNINAKIKGISDLFQVPKTKVHAISAAEGYGLVELVETVLLAAPKGAALSLGRAIGSNDESLLSNKSKETIKKDVLAEVVTAASAGALLGANVIGPIGALVGAFLGAIFGWAAA